DGYSTCRRGELVFRSGGVICIQSLILREAECEVAEFDRTGIATFTELAVKSSLVLRCNGGTRSIVDCRAEQFRQVGPGESSILLQRPNHDVIDGLIVTAVRFATFIG